MPWDPPELAYLPPEAQELMRFACTRMVHSYKPVLMLAILEQLPALSFPFDPVAEFFVRFYQEREKQGLPVERRPCQFATHKGFDWIKCRQTAFAVLRKVFDFPYRYLELTSGNIKILHTTGWLALHQTPYNRIVLRLLSQALNDFYERIIIAGEALYGMQPQSSASRPMVFFLSDSDDGEDMYIL